MASKKKTARKLKTGARPRTKAAPTVSAFMTRQVHTIGRDQTLARAHELMNKYRIRHQPVLGGGKLVGIVSQRDLYFVETFGPDKPEEIKVEEAMTQDVFEVPATAKLADVVGTMVRKKHGSAIVTENGKVVGVFSTIDALKALLSYL